MKIVIAPNALKGSLSAHAAALAIEQGAKRALSTIDVSLKPVADGGDGFAEVLADSLQATQMNILLTGPLGHKITAPVYINQHRSLAIIELATIAGLTLVPPEERNPLLTTSTGVGEAIKAALDAGARRLIIGVGGSATNDAGIGMAMALGARFLNSAGDVVQPIGRSLESITRIDISHLDKRIAKTNIEVACDVDNPLFGERGAAYVFAPQKGANPQQVVQLDNGLRNFANVVKASLDIDVSGIAGAGAAGGIGGALVAFCGARLDRGIDIVLDSITFDDALKNASLVLTAEGQLDCQTAHGKAPAGVAKRAKKQNIPCIILAGSVAINADDNTQSDFTAAYSICPGPVSLQSSMEQAFDFLSYTAEQVVRTFVAASEISLTQSTINRG